MSHPSFLDESLDALRGRHHLRSLRLPQPGLVDFTSNDYLGLAKASADAPPPAGSWGSGGSRLLAGNAVAHASLERECATLFGAEASLLFSSGYMANLALLSTLPRRGDTLLLDEQCHASLREGARLSLAQSFTFAHNDLSDLDRRLSKAQGTCFVVTEALFSMDGDVPPLREMLALCKRHSAWLLLDEAHSTGIVGEGGEGLAHSMGLHPQVLARVHTFGKAVGRMGAVIAGPEVLVQYLLNKARPFIYTTAMPEVMAESVSQALGLMGEMQQERQHLRDLRRHLDALLAGSGKWQLPAGDGPIVPIVIPGNEAVREAALSLQAAGLDVRPILSPTVPQGSERLRVILHSFNSFEEVERLGRELVG
jgi:8-amino-7-oxononanoate synthase